MNEVVLITGGTGKLGSALVRHFAANRRFVAFTSRSQGRADELVASLGAGGEYALSIEANFRDRDCLRDLPSRLAACGCSVTGLVNNARCLDTLRVDELGDTSSVDFLDEFELDVVVPYRLTLAFARSNVHALGSVVNVGSQYGAVAPNPALYGGSLAGSPIQYGVAKAALSHLTKELAVRLAPAGIRVNCVAFGGVEGRANEDFMRRYAALSPARRMLREEEVAGPVDFLLSDSSSAVNGQTLLADGGWTLW